MASRIFSSPANAVQDCQPQPPLPTIDGNPLQNLWAMLNTLPDTCRRRVADRLAEHRYGDGIAITRAALLHVAPHVEPWQSDPVRRSGTGTA